MSSSQVYGAPILMDGALRATSPNYNFRVAVAAGAHPSLGPVTVELDWVSDTYVVHTDVMTAATARIESPGFGNGGLLPGALQGSTYSPDYYYVFDRVASSLPPGVISLVVRVKAGGFTYQYGETVRVINHRDGSRMPCSERRYVNPIGGSNMNNGLSAATPMATIDFAIDSMLGGSVASADVAGRDLAGGEIIVDGDGGGRVSWNNGNWRTTGPGWLTIRGINGAKLSRVDPLAYAPSTDSMAFGSSSLPGEARVRLIGVLIEGAATPTMRLASGVTARLWVDESITKSRYFQTSTSVPGVQQSVRWADDYKSGSYFATDGFTASPSFRYFTACRWFGVINGPERYKLALDCTVGPFLGVAYYHNADVPTAITASCSAFGVAFEFGRTAGYVRIPEADALPGVTLTASTPSPGVLRIEAPSGYPRSILNDLIELGPTVPGLHTNPAYGIRIEGFTTTAINGTRKVIGSGISGGREYADFADPLTLAAPETTTNGRMYTASLRSPSVGVPLWDLHPDCLYLAGARTRDLVLGVAFYDCRNTQVMFTNGQGVGEPRNSCWYRNIRGPMNPDLVNNLKGCDHRNCLFENITDGGQIQFDPAFQHPGSLVLNSVFRTVGDDSTIRLTQLQWSHVHITNGPAIGTSGTTGPAWSGDPTVTPYVIEPLPAIVGTGLAGRQEPAAWAFSQDAPSRGAWKNTSTLSWSVPSEASPESGATESRPTNAGTDNPQARYRVFNQSGNTFDGWMPVNTDTLALGADAAGRSGGFYVHHGKATGLNTRMTDILVQLGPNTGVGLASVALEDSQTVSVPTVPVDYFGGEPAFAGVPMTLVSTTQDGRGVVRHWRLTHPADDRFRIQMWGRHYPGEPWMRAEILVVHNNINRPELSREWPGGSITYGNGELTIMGSPFTDGRIVEFSTTFYDAQGRAMPVLWAWPNRYRTNPNDASSVAALRTFLVDGHGITRCYPDGNAFEQLGRENWGNVGRDAMFAGLHDWSIPLTLGVEDGVVKSTNPTGLLGEQAFNMSHAYYRVSALPKAYALALYHAKKPCYYYEPSGEPLDIQARSGATFSASSVRLLAGRPVFTGGVTLPVLGKFTDLNLSAGTGVGGVNGWDGYGEQHDWASSLHEVTRLKGTPMLIHLLELHGVRWLGRWFDHPSFGSYFDIDQPRSNLMGMKTAAECYWGLKNRTLAEAIATRSRNRSVIANGAFEEMLQAPSSNQFWGVTTTRTSSIPWVPGYSGFINPAATYYFDLCMRVIGGMEAGGLRTVVNAARDEMLARTYRLLVPAVQGPYPTAPFVPSTVASTEWTAFEQQAVDPAIFSLSTDFSFSWPLLNIAHGVRDGLPKAIQVWTQLLARAPLGTQVSQVPWRKWFAPQPTNVATEVITGGSPGTAAGAGGTGPGGGVGSVGTGTAGTQPPGGGGNSGPGLIKGGRRGGRGGRSNAVRQWARMLGIEGIDP